MLPQARHTLALAQAKRLVLDDTIAEPGAQNKPSAGDHIKRRGFLGDSDRVQEW
jgi:hypothetical protein